MSCALDTCADARHTSGHASARRKHQSIKILAHLIRQNRSPYVICYASPMDGAILSELVHAAMITSLVFVMMAAVELTSVLTDGKASQALRGKALRQYVVSSFLGATPGCAGAYLVDTMYSRGVVSLGAVTAALLSTAGDEAFLMLAMFPAKALLLFCGLFVVGIVGGPLTDWTLHHTEYRGSECCTLATLHEEDLKPRATGQGWRPLRIRTGATGPRVALFVILLVLLLVVLTGMTAHVHASTSARSNGGHEGLVEQAILISVLVLGIGLVAVAPDHYIHEHLWHHLFLHHLPRIFGWTAGALIAVHLLMAHTSLHTLVASHGVLLLLGASILGLIPISGPHIIVVTLFATGQAPLSVLVANSIVQDGHGLLPLLGISVRDAVVAKAFNFVIGLTIGIILMAAGL